MLLLGARLTKVVTEKAAIPFVVKIGQDEMRTYYGGIAMEMLEVRQFIHFGVGIDTG